MSAAGGRLESPGTTAREPRRPAHQREFRRARAAGRRGPRARKGKGMARTARRPGRQAQVAGLLVALLACASVGPPPGGPADVTPLKIIHVQPDSGAVVPNFKGDAVIQFDKVIDE